MKEGRGGGARRLEATYVGKQYSSLQVPYLLLIRSPPKVTMLTRIEHPCVHNGSVSLDFLTELEKGKNKHVGSGATNRYKFWSPGYTVMSILMQLQGKRHLIASR